MIKTLSDHAVKLTIASILGLLGAVAEGSWQVAKIYFQFEQERAITQTAFGNYIQSQTKFEQKMEKFEERLDKDELKLAKIR